jgi:hypothetical protein
MGGTVHVALHLDCDPCDVHRLIRLGYAACERRDYAWEVVSWLRLRSVEAVNCDGLFYYA